MAGSAALVASTSGGCDVLLTLGRGRTGSAFDAVEDGEDGQAEQERAEEAGDEGDDLAPEDGNRQALAHFVTSSPWDPAHVRARLAWRMYEAIGPEALIVDDTGFLKDGDASAAVDWRLFLPASWAPASPEADAVKVAYRTRCGIPAQAGHVEKWQLALDMIDETRS